MTCLNHCPRGCCWGFNMRTSVPKADTLPTKSPFFLFLSPLCFLFDRTGALDKESYSQDSYPSLLKNFVSFRNEMSVILVLWHDCQQLIDRYNEEQVSHIYINYTHRQISEVHLLRKCLDVVYISDPHSSSFHSLEILNYELCINNLGKV